MELKEKVNLLAETMQCNCDLDKWQPELDTGHSFVCRIHRTAKEWQRNQPITHPKILAKGGIKGD